MRESITRAARAALVAVTAVLGFVTTSHAAVYVGVWDPPYGNAFPNLWAAGGAARSVSGNAVWGYLSGNGLLSAVAGGHIAAQTARALLENAA